MSCPILTLRLTEVNGLTCVSKLWIVQAIYFICLHNTDK